MTSTNSGTPARPWKRAFPVFLLLLAWAMFLYRDTAGAIVTIWLRSDTFAHGFLVPPIVAWLVWRQRKALVQRAPWPDFRAMALLAAVAFCWLLGDLAAINALTQLAFVAMLVLLVPALLGGSVARAIVFPLAFMFFAVPFGEFAMPQLMVWTADFTVLALRTSGIPVYREGLQFVIPSGNWSVVEACSGVRYLIASVTVGTLFAYLNYQSGKRRILFVLVSILVPVLANWLRAYIIVMLGHLSGNKLAAGVDHLIYGWLFFGVVIMLMFIVGARWAEPALTAQAAPGASGHVPDARSASGLQARLPLAALAMALLLAMPHLARWAIAKSDSAAAPQLAAPATLAAGWAESPEPFADWKPAFQNPSAEVSTTYQAGKQVVGLYLGYYRQQDYGRKLVSSENVLVRSNDPSWAQVSRGARSVNIGGKAHAMRVGELRGQPTAGQATGQRLLVWQIYWVNGNLTSSDVLAKAYSAWHRLLGRGDDSAVIIVYAPKGMAGEGDATLGAFVQTNISAIEDLLQKTRAKR